MNNRLEQYLLVDQDNGILTKVNKFQRFKHDEVLLMNRLKFEVGNEKVY